MDLKFMIIELEEAWRNLKEISGNGKLE